jgi:chemotaxis-related protein WspB
MLVLTFQVGSNQLALDVRDIREVVPHVPLQRVACGPPWLAGVFVYRGQVVPVLDLYRLVGAEDCPAHLSTRIVIVPRRHEGRERLLGLLASRVADVRELEPPAAALPRPAAPGQPDLGPVQVDRGQIIHLVAVDRLLPEAYRQQLALVAPESSA